MLKGKLDFEELVSAEKVLEGRGFEAESQAFDEDLSRSLLDVHDDLIYSDSRDFEDVSEAILKANPEDSFYFLNEGRLRHSVREFLDNFLADTPEMRDVAYAVKANSLERILRVVRDEGIDSFDCASMGEMQLLRGLFSSSHLMWGNPIRKKYEVKKAFDLGVRAYSVDSFFGINQILEGLDRNASDIESVVFVVRLKASKNVGASIDFSVPKFGASDQDVFEMLKYVKGLGAGAGLTIHTGSQNANPGSFMDALNRMADLAKSVGGLDKVNIGGGFPVNYFSKDDFRNAEYLQNLSNACKEYGNYALNEEGKFLVEPGRAIVAPAVDLVVSILEVDERDGVKMMRVDDGVFTSFSDYAIHGWEYPFRPFSIEGKEFSESMVLYKFWGRSCDPGDHLGFVALPDNLAAGDYLHVPAAGAYCSAQSSGFNGFPVHRHVVYNVGRLEGIALFDKYYSRGGICKRTREIVSIY